MIRILLQKDLWRARRNPWPYLINLALPVLITAIIGLAFGGASSGQGMGKIKIAIVDEDDNVLGSFLKNAFSQGESQDFMDPSFMKRDEALAQIKANELSAVFIIPEGFTESYIEDSKTPPLELIKNPAQRYHPAIAEEFLGVAVEGLNVVARNLGDEIPKIVEIVETDGFPDMIGIAAILVEMGIKYKKAENYLFPPLITFSETTETKNEVSEEPDFNIFALLLPMLSSVFLLFLADGAIRDLYKEINEKTLARMKTVQNRLFPIVLSKSILAVIVGIIGGLIWFIGGGMVFQIEWRAPVQLSILVVCYSICAAGFMALLVGLFKTEKRAEAFSSIIILSIAFLGGGFFTAESMPDFIKNQISPWMPNYWFIQSVRSLQFDRGTADWAFEAIKMLILGSVFLGIGTKWIHRNVESGEKA